MKQILALCVGGRTACCLLLSTVLNGKFKEQPQRKPRLYPPTVQIVDTASFGDTLSSAEGTFEC